VVGGVLVLFDVVLNTGVVDSLVMEIYRSLLKNGFLSSSSSSFLPPATFLDEDFSADCWCITHKTRLAAAAAARPITSICVLFAFGDMLLFLFLLVVVVVVLLLFYVCSGR
jgi:type IV secretory pathway TrbL component